MIPGAGRLATLSATLLAAGLPGAALACAFHFYAPASTTAEQIADAEVLLLAREDPDRPFFFAPTEVLRGDRALAGDVEFLVDSATRRRLVAEPGDTVLFAWDDTDEAWNRLHYVDAEFAPVLDAMLAIADAPEAEQPAMRLALAERLQDDANPKLRRIALEEFDAASYADLREIELRLDPETIRAPMTQITEAPWRPIRILLLGLTGHDAARSVIEAGLARTAASPRDLETGAWATAAMEINGSDGVASVAEAILHNASQPLDKIEETVAAMAVIAGSGDPALHPAIAEALGTAVALRPEVAGAVARQFYDRGDWSQAITIADAVDASALRNPADIMAVAAYLDAARTALGQ